MTEQPKEQPRVAVAGTMGSAVSGGMRPTAPARPAEPREALHVQQLWEVQPVKKEIKNPEPVIEKQPEEPKPVAQPEEKKGKELPAFMRKLFGKK